MLVTSTRELNDILRLCIRQGGPRGQAAKKIGSIQKNLELGLPAGAATTNHGESRIRNAIKYDLGGGFRLVTIQEDGRCLMLYFGDHDSTQRWLDDNRGLTITRNESTGRLDLINLPIDVRQSDLHPGPVTLDTRPYLKRLEDIDWKEVIPNAGFRLSLLKIGEANTDDDLWEWIAAMQEEDTPLASVLVSVFNSIKSDNLDQARAAIDAHLGKSIAADETTSLAEVATEEVLRADINSDRFVVLNDLSQAEWDRLLDPNRFQDWMVYLHPGQKRVVDEDFEKATVLTGVSGSGKTCVLIHRARRMAEIYPNERILILTLNKSLARLLENLVERLCVNGESGRIDVMSFHTYLQQLLESMNVDKVMELIADYLDQKESVDAFTKQCEGRELNRLFRAMDERELLTRFSSFLAQPETPVRRVADRLQVYVYSQDQALDLDRYLYEELELVRSAFRCYDEYRDYLEYERVGRTIQFQGARRDAVLEILKAWETHQLSNAFLDHMGLCQVALLAVDEANAIPDMMRYRSVLVDEFQDFSTLELELIRKIPLEQTNGLFITGDFAQKLYAKDLSFRKVGLSPQERVSRSIRKNYRNSRQILAAGDALIHAYPPVSSMEDDLAILDPELSSRDSAMPIAMRAADQVLEAWCQAREWLASGHVSFSVCIASANLKEFPISTILDRCPSDLKASELSGDYTLNSQEIVVSDITSIKGFEFSMIIVLGMDEGMMPPKGRPEAERWRDALRLYVAITRGRDEVRFIYTSTPSPFLESMREHVRWEIADIKEVESLNIGEPIKQIGTEDEQGICGNLELESGLIETASSEIDSSSEEIESEIEVLAQRNEGISEASVVPADSVPEIIFLNGIPIVPVPIKANQFQLAQALSTRQREISLKCQLDLHHFTDPLSPLPEHIILELCRRYGVVANLVRLRS